MSYLAKWVPEFGPKVLVCQTLSRDIKVVDYPMIWLLEFRIILSAKCLNNVDRQKVWEIETHFYLVNHTVNPLMSLSLSWGKFNTHTSEVRLFVETKSVILSYRSITLSKASPLGWNSATVRIDVGLLHYCISVFVHACVYACLCLDPWYSM